MHNNIAATYYDDHGVKQDSKEEKYHRECAAMEGHFTSRGCLHTIEYNEGNMNRAMMHWIIAAEAGHNKSLQEVQEGFMNGCVTKDQFEKTWCVHKKSVDEMQSG